MSGSKRKIGDFMRNYMELATDDSDSEDSDTVTKASSCTRKRSKVSQEQLHTQSEMALKTSHSDRELNKGYHLRSQGKPMTQDTASNDQQYSHRIVAYLGRPLAYVNGVLQGYTGSAAMLPVNQLSCQKLVLTCPCGDIWTQRYPDVSVNLRLRTNYKRCDSVIKILEGQNFQFQALLHRGEFGVAALGYSKFRARHEVVKMTHMDVLPKEDKATLSRSLQFHSQLDHDNIVKAFSHHTTHNVQCTFMEWCELGSLEELLKRSPGRLISEQVSRRYFIDLISGIEYIHSQNLVHMNICVENLFLDSKQCVKITNFNHMCAYMSGDKFPNGQRINIESHLPPEVFVSAPIFASFDPRKADIWACGVVLFQMLTGKLPFNTTKSGCSCLNLHEKQGIEPAFEMVSVFFSRDVKELLRLVIHPIPEIRACIWRMRNLSWFTQRIQRPNISHARLVHNALKHGIGEESRKIYTELKL